MSRGIFIIGTDTGVGKTVFSAGLMHLLLKHRYNAGYFKPIASGEIDMGGGSVPIDATFVKVVSGYSEEDERITPYSFRTPVSPHLAARLEGREIDFGVIRERLNDLKKTADLVVVEGCGGLAVPLDARGTMLYDLIRQTGLGCFLVARTGLGTINHTLLTLRVADDFGIAVAGVFMNGYTGSAMERDNIETLKRLTGHPAIFTIPQARGVDVDNFKAGELRTVFEQSLEVERLAGLMASF